MTEMLPQIIYIPGLKPKPEPAAHRRELLRCLLAGLGQVDEDSRAFLAQNDRCFDLVSWTYDFYGEFRDISVDMPGIDRLLETADASPADIAEAGSFKRRLLRAMYSAGDHLPFLIPHFAGADMEIQLRDLRRYVRNEFEISDSIRRLLKAPIRAAAQSGRPVLLISHSMGSVIAYDALWQLGQEGVDTAVDTLITMGSPLGQRYIQSRLLGAKKEGRQKYPSNIRHWRNVSAVGELTAIDMRLENDFGEMLELGLLQSFEDLEIYNWFRLGGELNVHAEYGYLANPVTARLVSKWIRAHRRPDLEN